MAHGDTGSPPGTGGNRVRKIHFTAGAMGQGAARTQAERTRTQRLRMTYERARRRLLNAIHVRRNRHRGLITKAEIDQQIATAHRFPRSIKRFVDEATAMVTLNESIARQCARFPETGKTIEAQAPGSGKSSPAPGATVSARRSRRVPTSSPRRACFTTWNEKKTSPSPTRSSAHHRQERAQVQARHDRRHGERAACSIALRNSILGNSLKAFWGAALHEGSGGRCRRHHHPGKQALEAIKAFAIFGVTEPMILSKVGPRRNRRHHRG